MPHWRIHVPTLAAMCAVLLASACSSGATVATTPAPAPSVVSKPAPAAAPADLGLVQAGMLTVATQDVQRPFTLVDQSGQRSGFAIDTVDEIARRLNLKTTYTAMSLTALLPAVGTDQYDLGAIGLQVTDERKQTIEFSTAYYWGYAELLVPKTAPAASLDAMAGKSVAAIRGTVQEQTLKDKYPNVVLKSFDSQPNALAALRGGQVDGFLVGGADAEDYSRQDASLTVTQQIPSDNPTAMPIAKGKTALVAAIDAQLNAMMQDGTYKQLYAKWFSEPLLPQFLALHPNLAGQANPFPGAWPMNVDAVVRTFFNPSELGQVLPQLVLVGLRNTLGLSLFAIALALIIGLGLALLLVASNPFARAPARIYVDVFRGLPVILTVLLVGSGLPIAGIRPFGRDTYAYAVLALALVNGAYISEIFRSGIQSVERGQMDAARALGLSYLQTMRLVIVPQGIRRVLPALTNQFIVCIKESSFVYLLGLSAEQRELFTIGQDQDALTGGLTGLVAAGLVYLSIVLPLTYAVNWLDRRLRDGARVRVQLPVGEATPAGVGTREGVL